MSAGGRKTPLRDALLDTSSLLPSIADGLSAVARAHRVHFDPSIRADFEDSIELDEAMRVGRDNDHRWDYVLGHGPTRKLVAVEPHSAKQDEVDRVIRKRRAAREHLRGHLRDGRQIVAWLWVASGKVQFANTEKTALRLAQEGIEFVGTRVRAKHLPASDAADVAPSEMPSTTGRRRRRV